MSVTEEPMRTVFSTIDEAIDDIRAGKIVIVVDDADRENEGDFIMAAERVTPQALNFMVTHGRGIVCMPLMGQRLDELRIPLMVSKNNESHGTAFAVSIDIQGRTTTGTSAFDRAATVRAIVDPELRPDDIRMPGHVFPLMAMEGGVLKRAGHTEATVDLARLAGLYPAGVLCEVLHPDGSMARMPELIKVAEEHDLRIISIADLIEYRRHREHLVARTAEAQIPTEHGEFTAHTYESLVDGNVHVAFVLGEIGDGEEVLVRVHSECLTGDVFGSLRCDCGDQLHSAIAQVGRGGSRGGAVHPRTRGPCDRTDPQAQGLPAPGGGPGHRRGQRGARLRGRPARVRDRCADPRRPRGPLDALADEQPRPSAPASRATACRSPSGSRWRRTRRRRTSGTCGRSARSSGTCSTTWSRTTGEAP